LIIIGWVWVIFFVIEGLLILAGPFAHPTIRAFLDQGQGTALLLIAASILFVAIATTASETRPQPLVNISTWLTAVFGFSGTLIILANENPVLAVLVVTPPVYGLWITFAVILTIRFFRQFRG
jgi:hypothetical protein